MLQYSMAQKLFAELLGTAFLLATVVGSGIMGERLADGNDAIALLGNTIPTGAILIVLITTLGPISGGHFNPAVTFVFWLSKAISVKDSALYITAQIIGGLLGVLAAHFMFEETLVQFSQKVRTGEAQALAEVIAAFGLVFTILATLKFKREAVAVMVGLYITAAYWFTASTSFANPAVTIARTLSDTFSGIHYGDTLLFIGAQIIGATLAMALVNLWSD